MSDEMFVFVDLFGLRAARLVSLLLVLSSFPAAAWSGEEAGRLAEAIEFGEPVEVVTDVLSQHQFRMTSYVVQGDEFLDPRGFVGMSPRIFHPDLPENFFEICSDQDCHLIRSTKKHDAALSGFDHEYRYLWLFVDDRFARVFVDHGRWIRRK